MTNHAFCKQLLKETLVDVEKIIAHESIKAAWAIGSKGRYEFFGPDRFHAYVKADCIVHAKANGWSEYLQSKGLV